MPESAYSIERLQSRPSGLSRSRTEASHYPDNRDGRFAAPADDLPNMAAAAAAQITATPFEWCDPSKIPPREWLYGRHLIRKYVSATISPGGVGKSSLALVEALAMVSGKSLLGEPATDPLRVWYWNGEDPIDELQRRVMAIAVHYGLTSADFGGRLFINSGRDTEIVIARQNRDGVTVAVPVVEAIKATIRENGIDLVVIDPFVSSHQVPENDNGAIDRVAKTWGAIAGTTNCAIELVHHSRKTNGAEVTVEDSRGGGSLVYATRSTRALNVMTKEEAEKAGVERRRSYFRADNGKGNLTAPPEGSTWFKLISVPLPNGGTIRGVPLDGDSVGVVTAWQWPDAMASVTVSHLREVQSLIGKSGEWRASVQSPNWAGIAVGQAMGLDPTDPKDRTTIKAALKTWLGTGMLKQKMIMDDARRERPCIVVGELASD